MNIINVIKIPVATIFYSSNGKKLKTSTKPFTVRKIQPKVVVNIQKKIFSKENKIKKIKLSSIVIESKRFIKYNKKSLFLEIKAKIIVRYLDEYLKSNVLVGGLVIRKIINIEQKSKNLKPVIKIKNLSVENCKLIIADIVLYLI